MNRSHSLTLALVISLTCIASLAASSAASIGDPVLNYGERGKAVLHLGAPSAATAAIAQSGGRLVVAGVVGEGAAQQGFVARLNSDGKRDLSFGVDGIVKLGAAGSVRLASSASGGIYALDDETVQSPREIFALTGDGQPISTFGVDGKVELSEFFPGFSADAIAVQGNSLLIAGSQRVESTVDREAILTRLTPDGSIDASFGNAGSIVGRNEASYGGPSIAVLRDGSIVTTVGGLAKFGPNGVPDIAFHAVPPPGHAYYGNYFELAPTPSGGFAAIRTVGYWGKGLFVVRTATRYNAYGSTVATLESNLLGGTPVVLANDAIVAVDYQFLSSANGNQMEASLIPAGGSDVGRIEQTAGLTSIALSATELPGEQLALVGQSCIGECNAVISRIRLIQSTVKKLSPGLRKPRRVKNYKGTVKRISGIAKPAKGIRSVSVAIRKADAGFRRAAPCRWLGTDRVRFVRRAMTPTGPCGKPIFIRAKGGKRWHLDLPRALPNGIYELFVRGHWKGGRYNELTNQPGSYLRFYVTG